MLNKTVSINNKRTLLISTLLCSLGLVIVICSKNKQKNISSSIEQKKHVLIMSVDSGYFLYKGKFYTRESLSKKLQKEYKDNPTLPAPVFNDRNYWKLYQALKKRGISLEKHPDNFNNYIK